MKILKENQESWIKDNKSSFQSTFKTDFQSGFLIEECAFLAAIGIHKKEQI